MGLCSFEMKSISVEDFNCQSVSQKFLLELRLAVQLSAMWWFQCVRFTLKCYLRMLMSLIASGERSTNISETDTL